jgi:heat shock protein HslJ
LYKENPMKPERILGVLAIIVSLVLSACSQSQQTTNSLNGTSWLLVDLNGQSILPETVITLNFGSEKVSGTDGCNNYSASYMANGEKINIGKDVTSTMEACPDPIMQQASAYITALIQSSSYKTDGQQLTLLDAGGKNLATFKIQKSELGGTSWIVTGYNNGNQAVVSVIIHTELTAEFSIAGLISGSAGCNTYNASFETTGKGIKIGPAATTRKMCAEPAGVMEQETQYLTALGTAANYMLDGNKLELRTSDGALAVQFTSAPTAASSSPTQTTQTDASISLALPNAEYPIEVSSTGKAQLKNGVFEEPSAPDSATKNRVELNKDIVLGDLNGDGLDDAVVTLVADPGGSGTFTYLAFVINENGVAKPTTSILLGDRIIVKSITNQSGEVVVTILTRKPDEPMTSKPTQEVKRTFKLQGDQLEEVK